MFTLHILAVGSEASKAQSYQGMISNLLGNRARIIITICMFFYLFGACVGAWEQCILHFNSHLTFAGSYRFTAYQNVVADQLLPVLANVNAPEFIQKRYVLIPIYTLIVIVPLCLLRDLKSLEFTSLLAVVSITFVEGDVLYKYFSMPSTVHVRMIMSENCSNCSSLVLPLLLSSYFRLKPNLSTYPRTYWSLSLSLCLPCKLTWCSSLCITD